MEIETLKHHLLDLENRMLQSENRQSKEKMGQFLTADFFEFGSSGRVYIFRDDDFQVQDQDSPDFDCEIRDFAIILLATDVALATYKIIKHHELRNDLEYSLRSSVWKCFSGQWKTVFHQGTPTTK